MRPLHPCRLAPDRNLMAPDDAELMALARAIVSADDAVVMRMLTSNPALASARFAEGATRQGANVYYFEECGYIYQGHTALHVAASVYRSPIVRQLIAAGADIRARNRHGAEPIHLAATGVPGSPTWNPSAQAETIACLIAAGADPSALDKRGVAPLHRAVRTRCAAAVSALLEAGADPSQRNGNGSTPMLLARRNTGRGGSGSPAAKEQQERIVVLLRRHGAAWLPGSEQQRN
jgi:Ankyrin repeats (many copies)/Ankyrin repeat